MLASSIPLFLIAAGLHAQSESESLRRFSYKEIAMGCEMRVEIYAANETIADPLARAAFARVHALDEILSDYRASSEVSRLDPALGQALPIGRDLSSAVTRSLRVSDATDGAFDATVGSISRVWRIARSSGVLPSGVALSLAAASAGWRGVTLAPDGSTINITRPQLRFDFGGIGKGIAAQAALETIQAGGASRALCALAGDIACGDPPPDSPGWIIAVASGIDAIAPCTVTLSNACISTSGDEAQHLEVDGVRYSHIFDPRTGRAVTRRIAATVISPDGAVADGLASALCVDGPPLLDKLPLLRERLGPFEARVIETECAPSAAPSVRETDGWRERVRTTSPPAQASRPPLAGADQTAATAASDSSGQPAPHPK